MTAIGVVIPLVDIYFASLHIYFQNPKGTVIANKFCHRSLLRILKTAEETSHSQNLKCRNLSVVSLTVNLIYFLTTLMAT